MEGDENEEEVVLHIYERKEALRYGARGERREGREKIKNGIKL